MRNEEWRLVNGEPRARSPLYCSLLTAHRSLFSAPPLWLRLLALTVLALLLRGAALGRYVTPDEPIWVLRSIEFGDALAAQTWDALPQTGHPGVTTMALGAGGVAVTTVLFPEAAAEHLVWLRALAWLAPENGAAFPRLGFFLTGARLWIMAVTSAGVALIYALARPRLGERAARVLALCLALDPFLAGLSGLLHTDALQATFALLAALLALPRRAAPRASWPALAGAALCLALTGLTKTLGLLVAPGIALALLLGESGPRLRRALRVAALTALSALLLAALYPPTWSDPRAALATLVGAVGYHEGIGLRNVFFAGQMTPDPGPLFYPAVLLFRLTPPVLIGLLLLGVRGGWQITNYKLQIAKRKSVRGNGTWGLREAGSPFAICHLSFVLPALTYLAVLTLATKKFDRYALTVLVLLAAAAASVWARWWANRRARLALLAGLLWPWALVAPAPLYYANPLLGGPWLAQRIVPLGWGEGYGLAAGALAHHLPDAESATLLTHNVPGTASLFPGVTRSARGSRALAPCAAAFIGDTTTAPPSVDYRAVAQITLAGVPLATGYRHSPTLPALTHPIAAGMVAGLPAEARAPDADAATLAVWLAERLAGAAEFDWMRASACAPATDAQLAALLAEAADCVSQPLGPGVTLARCRLVAPLPEAQSFIARFGPGLELLAAALPETGQSPAALFVPVRWRVSALLPDLDFYLELTDAAGTVWLAGGNLLVDVRTWPTSAWPMERLVEGEIYLPLPPHLPPGEYRVRLSLHEAAGKQWGLWYPDAAFGGTRLDLGVLRLLPPPYPAAELPGLAQPLEAAFPGLLLLGASALPERVWAGDALPLALGWERTAGAAVDTLHWELVCAETHITGTLPLASDDWPGGQRYVTRHALPTDPLLAAGACTVYVGGETRAPVAVGTFAVQPRARSFDWPESPPLPLAVTIGDWAQLAGAGLPESPVAPGEVVPVTLYFAAEARASLDYTVFVHLVGPDGATWAQSDAPPEGGNAPTTSWVAGQRIVDRHAPTLPLDAPPGEYTVFVGLYAQESGGRVSLYAAPGARLTDDRARVGSFRVP